MKKTVILVLAASVLAFSCKTMKKASTPDGQYQTTLNEGSQAKVFSVPEINNTKPAIPEEKPIAVRKESVTFTEKADASKNVVNNYFVIVGSFGSIDNAKKYRETLISEGFTPIILHSNTSGYYRICVNSFKKEMEARERVHNIRKDFPKYNDAWLLIKE